MIASEAISESGRVAAAAWPPGLRVTQATLSRDITELRLVKTASGYKALQQAATDDGTSSPICLRWRAL